MVTPEGIDGARGLEIWCEVDGSLMQKTRTSDLLFSPADVIAYTSQATARRPGDLILTGTVGASATPASHRCTSSKASSCAPTSRASASA